ncbi:MAG: nucleoside triphosphate pyrophosphohydrolase family protein [Bacteroidales bacterium]|nr:nucleoside triphosphate pyrophosphohydrolase family protein [Bacteroidales bacterium]
MTLNEYQEGARSTAIYPESRKIIYPTLGLTGEAGEVADKVKKVIRDNNDTFSEEKKHEIALELGDVLWYAASLAHDLGFSLDEVAKMNLDKLASRMKRDKIHGNGDER